MYSGPQYCFSTQLNLGVYYSPWRTGVVFFSPEASHACPQKNTQISISLDEGVQFREPPKPNALSHPT